MSHTRIFIVAAVFMMLLAAPNARSQQVTGQVRYADTNQPAFQANVHCDGIGTSHIEQTDFNGRFTCRLGAQGNYTVRVDAPGYVQEQQSGTATDVNQVDQMLFRLKPLAPLTPKFTSVVDSKVPAEAHKQFDLGLAALANGKKEGVEESIRCFEKAIGIYPNFVEALLRMGTAYMELAQWDKAEQALKKTLAIDPKAANALFALGEVYLRQKKNDEAEKSLLEGLQLDANSVQGHLTLGRVYWDSATKIKDDAQARPTLEKAYEEAKKTLALNPNLPDAHVLKGNLLLRVRRAEDAQHEFEEYLRLEPKGPFAEQARILVDKIKKALAPGPK